MRNLKACKTDEFVKVNSLQGGNTFINRATSLGFVPGIQLKILKNSLSGPLIVEIRDSQVAIGKGEAMKIMVEDL